MTAQQLVYVAVIADSGPFDEFAETLQTMKAEFGMSPSVDALPVGRLRVLGPMPGKHQGYYVALTRPNEAVVQVLLLRDDWACQTIEEATALVASVCRTCQRDFGHLPTSVVIRRDLPVGIAGGDSRSVH